MTPDAFRALAMAQPEAIEAGHMGKADFRVGKKIFATLDEAAGLGNLKLDAILQAEMRDRLGEPVFPANGAWGQKGWTRLTLGALATGDVAPWMREAWRLTAPVTIRLRHEADQ